MSEESKTKKIPNIKKNLDDNEKNKNEMDINEKDIVLLGDKFIHNNPS